MSHDLLPPVEEETEVDVVMRYLYLASRLAEVDASELTDMQRINLAFYNCVAKQTMDVIELSGLVLQGLPVNMEGVLVSSEQGVPASSDPTTQLAPEAVEVSQTDASTGSEMLPSEVAQSTAEGSSALELPQISEGGYSSS